MDKKAYDIIGVGSPIVDSLAQVEESFVAGIEGAKGGMELVDATAMAALMAQVKDALVEAPGGSAGNSIFALARLGLSTTFLGKIGNDVGADFYKRAYEEMGGDSGRFKIGDVPNGRCLSLVTPDSERTMRTDLGAAMSLMPEEISAEDFAGCKHAHIEGYLLFNPNLMRKVLDSAKEAGCTVSLDLASFEVVNAARDGLEAILKNDIDIVFANEEEATAYCGKGKSYEDMAKELGALCEIAVVKLGKDGSLICQGGTLIRVEPIVVSDVVDTTAAGDFWAAGFLYGWIQGKSLAGAGSCGSILGAEVVQVMGSVLKTESWESVRQRFEALK